MKKYRVLYNGVAYDVDSMDELPLKLHTPFMILQAADTNDTSDVHVHGFGSVYTRRTGQRNITIFVDNPYVDNTDFNVELAAHVAAHNPLT